MKKKEEKKSVYMARYMVVYAYNFEYGRIYSYYTYTMYIFISHANSQVPFYRATNLSEVMF